MPYIEIKRIAETETRKVPIQLTVYDDTRSEIHFYNKVYSFFSSVL